MDWQEDVREARQREDAPSREPIPVVEQDARMRIRVRLRDGEVREGWVRVHVPEPNELLSIGQAKTRMAGGPWSHLDPNTQGTIEAMVTVQTMLLEQPSWLRDALSKDNAVLVQIAEVLLGHQLLFFRRAPLPGYDTPESGLGIIVDIKADPSTIETFDVPEDDGDVGQPEVQGPSGGPVEPVEPVEFNPREMERASG